jgi:multiple sugar transport system substrate-binding protein
MKTITYIITASLFLSACALANDTRQGDISLMVFGDPAELKAYQALASAFEARNPGTRVQLVHIPGQSEYRARLAADFAAGTPADVVLFNYRRFAPYAAKNALEPLEKYLAKSDQITVTDFYPQVIEAFTWQNELYCIPQNISSLVVYYNKNLFDQVGLAYPADDWTWNDFLKTAQALTRDLDGDGLADQHGIGFEVSLARFAPFIWQHGGEIANSNTSPTSLVLDWPLSSEAIKWVTELQTQYHVTPDAEEGAAENSESRFMNGRLGMFLNSRRGVPTYRQANQFDWDVAPLPRDRHIASALHSDGYCMASVARNKDLAWKFIEFANSPTGQEIIASTGRTVPSLIAVAESPAFLDPNQKPANNRGAFLATIPYLRALPVKPGWVSAEEAADKELERAFYGQASLEEAIQLANSMALPYLSAEADAP